MKRQSFLVLAMVAVVLSLGETTKADMSYNLIDLGTLGGTESHALYNNNSGQTVGLAEIGSGYRGACLFDSTGGGNNIDLGTLGGTFSYA